MPSTVEKVTWTEEKLANGQSGHSMHGSDGSDGNETEKQRGMQRGWCLCLT